VKVTSACILTHYDPSLSIAFAADASAFALGVVMSYVFPDGSEYPIVFASHILTASECNYAQLQKEILSLAFSAKFHRHLYGQKFTLACKRSQATDNYSRAEEGYTISLAATCLQRWACLSAYDFNICYKSTTEHSNADGLSRLPLPFSNSLPLIQVPLPSTLGKYKLSM